MTASTTIAVELVYVVDHYRESWFARGSKLAEAAIAVSGF
jgi:hypothetical protein